MQFLGDDEELAQVPGEVHPAEDMRSDIGRAGPVPSVHVSPTNRIKDIFAAVDVDAQLHAVDIDGGAELSVCADEPVVLASIFKILLVLEFARQAAAGQLDPTERVVVRAADRLGGWGTAGCADDAELSLRDLAYFAMAFTDNTAADLLLRRVGPDVLPLLAAELGLAATRIIGGPRELLESMYADVGAAGDEEFVADLPDPVRGPGPGHAGLRPGADHVEHAAGGHPAARADLARRGRSAGRDGAWSGS